MSVPGHIGPIRQHFCHLRLGHQILKVVNGEINNFCSVQERPRNQHGLFWLLHFFQERKVIEENSCHGPHSIFEWFSKEEHESPMSFELFLINLRFLILISCLFVILFFVFFCIVYWFFRFLFFFNLRLFCLFNFLCKSPVINSLTGLYYAFWTLNLVTCCQQSSSLHHFY